MKHCVTRETEKGTEVLCWTPARKTFWLSEKLSQTWQHALVWEFVTDYAARQARAMHGGQTVKYVRDLAPPRAA